MVWTSAWPIHSWTRRMSATAIIRRAEGVAQVVEAQRSQAGSLERCGVAAPECGAVEVVAELAGEDQVLVFDPVLAVAQDHELVRDLRRHGNRADPARLRGAEVTVDEAAAHADGVRP